MSDEFKAAVKANIEGVTSLAQALTESLYETIDNDDAPRQLGWMEVMLAAALAVRGVAELLVHKDGKDRDEVETVFKAAFSSASKSEVHVMRFKTKSEFDEFMQAAKNGVH